MRERNFASRTILLAIKPYHFQIHKHWNEKKNDVGENSKRNVIKHSNSRVFENIKNIFTVPRVLSILWLIRFRVQTLFDVVVTTRFHFRCPLERLFAPNLNGNVISSRWEFLINLHAVTVKLTSEQGRKTFKFQRSFFRKMLWMNFVKNIFLRNCFIGSIIN